VKPPAWSLRLTAAAEADFKHTVRWSARQFGDAQARTYSKTLSLALEALVNDGPDTVGVQRRDEIAKGLRSLHVARGHRRGRHFVIFRVRREGDLGVIEVLRLLHDAMGFPRHLPSTDRLKD
jgi:toxin ParE1/3/4